jgi:hypothetical protein
MMAESHPVQWKSLSVDEQAFRPSTSPGTGGLFFARSMSDNGTGTSQTTEDTRMSARRSLDNSAVEQFARCPSLSASTGSGGNNSPSISGLFRPRQQSSSDNLRRHSFLNSRQESQRSISSAFQIRPDAQDPENLVLPWAVKVLDDVESTLTSLHAILKEIKVQQSQSDVDPRVIDGMLRLQEIEDAFIAGGGLQFPSNMRNDLDRVMGRFDRLELQIHSAKADLQRETKSIDERLSALEHGGGFMVIRPFPA